jgi:hypothetical protein
MIVGKERIDVMNEGKMKSLEQLEPAKLEWLLDIAAQSRLIDCVDALKEQGIAVSIPTLSRFVKKHRAKSLLDSGEGLAESAEALRKRGKNGAFREATMEALRQRLFEKAINEMSADEELREMYLDLVKEEAKLKELELAERRVAVAEDQARLARVKARAALDDRPPRRVELEESEVVREAAGPTKLLEAKSESSGKEAKQRLIDLIVNVAGVINGPGFAEEKVLEARLILAAGMKMVEEARSP